jgi:hypothetical protein
MPPFLYRCPNTGQKAQGLTVEEAFENTYEAILCVACRRLHFVNPKTGKVVGQDDEQS